jgi:GNAT superfamily N-acetyltransferase
MNARTDRPIRILRTYSCRHLVVNESSGRVTLHGRGNQVTVVDARPLMPSGVQELHKASRSEGIANISNLVRQWNDGTVRFDGDGETLLVAQVRGVNVGVGGLLQCKDVLGALRVSRFYVLPAWRRHGVGSVLAMEVIRRSEWFTDRVTCNAMALDVAEHFWESLGFVPVKLAGVTHIHDGVAR